MFISRKAEFSASHACRLPDVSDERNFEIYGAAAKNIAAIKAPGAPWEVGITYSTAKGSRGAAVYEQRGLFKTRY